MRLLIVKLADIGDLITATPAIAAAVAAPDVEVSVLTSPHAAPLLAGLGGAVEVLAFAKADFDVLAGLARPDRLLRGARLALGLHGRRFDAVAILHHLTTPAGVVKYRALAAATGAARVAGLDNGRGGFLTDPVADPGFGALPESEYAMRVVAALGVPRPASLLPRVWVDAEQERRGRALAAGLGGPGFVAIHPGTGPAAPARLYPTGHWAAVAERLQAAGCRVALVGGDGDRAEVAGVQAAGPGMAGDAVRSSPWPERVGGMSLAEVAGLLAEAALFVGADSGLLHLAAAQGVPTVGLFGPTDPAAWAPVGEHVRVVRSGVACSPCLYQPGRPPLRIACAKPFCLHAIAPDAVAGVCLLALAGSPVAARVGS
ncbi:MAG TPA: glycosyltransferase family 9 protein [Candidatus Dormibacteraeota bacterium]|jgi:ADP-heptose:LPS heptosyltransferase|nr:glycosyltransferase family 9 protein [Candidatus Dormibacteraeota bacterium]